MLKETLRATKATAASTNANFYGRNSGLAKATAATWILELDGEPRARLLNKGNRWTACSLDGLRVFGGRHTKAALLEAIRNETITIS